MFYHLHNLNSSDVITLYNYIIFKSKESLKSQSYLISLVVLFLDIDMDNLTTVKDPASVYAYSLISAHHDMLWFSLVISIIVIWSLIIILRDYTWNIDTTGLYKSYFGFERYFRAFCLFFCVKTYFNFQYIYYVVLRPLNDDELVSSFLSDVNCNIWTRLLFFFLGKRDLVCTLREEDLDLDPFFSNSYELFDFFLRFDAITVSKDLTLFLGSHSNYSELVYDSFTEILKVKKFNNNLLLEFTFGTVPFGTVIHLLNGALVLLYSLNENIDPILCLKVLGNQWFWIYEYAGFVFFESTLDRDFIASPELTSVRMGMDRLFSSIVKDFVFDADPDYKEYAKRFSKFNEYFFIIDKSFEVMKLEISKKHKIPLNVIDYFTLFSKAEYQLIKWDDLLSYINSSDRRKVQERFIIDVLRLILESDKVSGGRIRKVDSTSIDMDLFFSKWKFYFDNNRDVKFQIDNSNMTDFLAKNPIFFQVKPTVSDIICKNNVPELRSFPVFHDTTFTGFTLSDFRNFYADKRNAQFSKLLYYNNNNEVSIDLLQRINKISRNVREDILDEQFPLRGGDFSIAELKSLRFKKLVARENLIFENYDEIAKILKERMLFVGKEHKQLVNVIASMKGSVNSLVYKDCDPVWNLIHDDGTLINCDLNAMEEWALTAPIILTQDNYLKLEALNKFVDFMTPLGYLIYNSIVNSKILLGSGLERDLLINVFGNPNKLEDVVITLQKCFAKLYFNLLEFKREKALKGENVSLPFLDFDLPDDSFSLYTKINNALDDYDDIFLHALERKRKIYSVAQVFLDLCFPKAREFITSSNNFVSEPWMVWFYLLDRNQYLTFLSFNNGSLMESKLIFTAYKELIENCSKFLFSLDTMEALRFRSAIQWFTDEFWDAFPTSKTHQEFLGRFVMEGLSGYVNQETKDKWTMDISLSALNAKEGGPNRLDVDRLTKALYSFARMCHLDYYNFQKSQQNLNFDTFFRAIFDFNDTLRLKVISDLPSKRFLDFTYGHIIFDTFIGNRKYNLDLSKIRNINDIKFDSVLVAEDDLSLGSKRLLEVNKRVVLPTNVPIRILVASGDVLHSWTLAELGIKVDAVPGRLNNNLNVIRAPGVFYGQCSELCGIGHGYMPIVIQAVDHDVFVDWVKQVCPKAEETKATNERLEQLKANYLALDDHTHIRTPEFLKNKAFCVAEGFKVNYKRQLSYLDAAMKQAGLRAEIDSKEVKEMESKEVKEIDSKEVKEIDSKEVKEIDSKEVKEIDSKEVKEEIFTSLEDSVK